MSVRRSPAQAPAYRIAPVGLAPTGAASLVAVPRAGEAHRRRGGHTPTPVGARPDPWETFFESATKKLEKEPTRPASPPPPPPPPREDVKLTTRIADLQAQLARCKTKQATLLRDLERNAMEKEALMEENGILIEKWQEFVDARKEAQEPPEPASPKAPYEELDAPRAEERAEARERYTEDPAYEAPDMRGWNSLTDENRARAVRLAEEEASLRKQLEARDAERDNYRRIIADAMKRGAARDPSMAGNDFYDPGFGFGVSVESA